MKEFIFSKIAGCGPITLQIIKSIILAFQEYSLSYKLTFLIVHYLWATTSKEHLSVVISDVWLFLIHKQSNTNFGTIPWTKRYTDNTIQTSLVHVLQRLVCWFRDYCTRVIGIRLWKNTLLSTYAPAQGSIENNCSDKCGMTHWKRKKIWCCYVK